MGRDAGILLESGVDLWALKTELSTCGRAEDETGLRG